MDDTLKEKLRKYIQEYLQELSSTGTGASFTAGEGEQFASPKAFSKSKTKNNKATQHALDHGWTIAEQTKIKNILKQELLSEVSYSKFKKEVKNRTKSESLHKAVKEIKSRFQEIDRLLEYTQRMKVELNEEGDGGNYWKKTEKYISEISEVSVSIGNRLKNLYK